MKQDESVEQQRTHFNEISDKYFTARQSPNHLHLKMLIWKHFFQRNHFLAAEVARVLEPMCGMAEGYSILKSNLKTDFNYLGFDYSENMVSLAKTANPSLDIIWNDVTKFSHSGESFDLILLIGGLHHVYSRTDEVLVNLRHALREGGYFLSFEPTHDNFMARGTRQRIYQNNPLFDDDTEQGFEYRDLQSHFRNAGFIKIDEVYPGLLSYILYYNPDAFPALNIGGLHLVSSIFSFDKLFWANSIGRKMSFATISLWKKS